MHRPSPAVRALALALALALAIGAATACRTPGASGASGASGAPSPAPPLAADGGEPTGSAPQERRRLDRALRDVIRATGDVTGAPRPQDFGQAGASQVSSAASDAETGGDWLVAPIPFVDPTIGAGLAVGGAYLWKLDAESPPSTLGAGVMGSDNGSFGGALGFKGYLDGDRTRVAAGLLATRLEFDLSVAGAAIPLRENVVALFGELLFRVGSRTYLGPRIVLTGVDTDVVLGNGGGALPDDELDTINLGIGGRLQRDTRDSTHYPRRGSFADLELRVYDEALGSPSDYGVLPVSTNHYLSLGERDVLALRVAGRFAGGDVPFYGQSYFGAGGDLRGYPVGDHQDDVLVAAQAEYRRELGSRFGAVAFAGLGKVAPDLDELDDARSLSSAGFGLRYTLETTNHVNFRIDFAWGRDEAVVYLGVGEAF